MNVIPFPVPSAAAQTVPQGWHHVELQQLLALHAAQVRIGNADAWDIDVTERADPQFYLLGSEHECIACISRVGRTYVLENGEGMVVSEERHLAAAIARATQMLPRKRGAAILTRLVLMMCAVRVMIDEKLEPLIPDSTEMLARVVPPLAAFV